MMRKKDILRGFLNEEYMSEVDQMCFWIKEALYDDRIPFLFDLKQMKHLIYLFCINGQGGNLISFICICQFWR